MFKPPKSLRIPKRLAKTRLKKTEVSDKLRRASLIISPRFSDEARWLRSPLVEIAGGATLSPVAFLYDKTVFGAFVRNLCNKVIEEIAKEHSNRAADILQHQKSKSARTRGTKKRARESGDPKVLISAESGQPSLAPGRYNCKVQAAEISPSGNLNISFSDVRPVEPEPRAPESKLKFPARKLASPPLFGPVKPMRLVTELSPHDLEPPLPTVAEPTAFEKAADTLRRIRSRRSASRARLRGVLAEQALAQLGLLVRTWETEAQTRDAEVGYARGANFALALCASAVKAVLNSIPRAESENGTCESSD